jgi:hypothetical protein
MILLTIHAAQPASAQKFEGGLNAGLCASQVAGDTYSGYNKAGVFAGGYVGLRLNERTALHLELDYIQKGSRNNPGSDSSAYNPNYILRVNYVEMPLLLMINYGKKFTAEIGPAMSFLVNSYEESGEIELIEGVPLKKQNLSLIIGASYLLNERLSVGLRTNNSLFTIREKNNVEHYRKRLGVFGQFNDVLVIHLSYKL